MLLGNGRREQTQFNGRLQPTQITLDSNTAGANLLTLTYGYGSANNNGNVLSQTIVAGTGGPGALIMNQTYSGLTGFNRQKRTMVRVGLRIFRTTGLATCGSRTILESSFRR